jgi:AraC-like DNA-binding protein
MASTGPSLIADRASAYRAWPRRSALKPRGCTSLLPARTRSTASSLSSGPAGGTTGSPPSSCTTGPPCVPWRDEVGTTPACSTRSRSRWGRSSSATASACSPRRTDPRSSSSRSARSRRRASRTSATASARRPGSNSARRLARAWRRTPAALTRRARRGTISQVTNTPAAAQHLRDLVLLRRVRDRIDREYQQPLDVEALARGAHMSAGHLSREFRRAFGESPYSYLMTRRIERARSLLLRGDLSVTEF